MGTGGASGGTDSNPDGRFEEITKEISDAKSEIIRWIVATAMASTATIAALVWWVLG